MSHRSKDTYRKCMLLAATVLLAQLVIAQGRPQVTGVEPPSGKVNDDLTLTGENLGEETVSAVFLSDDEKDYKATVVEQASEKIVIKVPEVLSGRYNVSVQVGNQIFILPVRFAVEESGGSSRPARPASLRFSMQRRRIYCAGIRLTEARWGIGR